MVNQDDSFIREVNDELRSDQMRLVWKRFGRILIGVAVLVVLGTIGKVSYEYWRDSEASAAGDDFLAALTLAREGKKDEALAALTNLEKDGFGSYPVLARMRSASLLAESDVVCSVLRNWDALPGLIGGALYVGGEMAAFAVGEPLDDQTIVVHFEKGRPEYRGVYQAINFCFAKYAAKNFVFINREQDADEEGLRQAKESYMPSGYLKKNTIRIVK